MYAQFTFCISKSVRSKALEFRNIAMQPNKGELAQRGPHGRVCPEPKQLRAVVAVVAVVAGAVAGAVAIALAVAVAVAVAVAMAVAG